ncbi:MAG: membrane protein insertase YidC [Alphaproteobacteria bacterium]|nr:membrane protein insertase YidC [Alphaproteobacteria bacterium]
MNNQQNLIIAVVSSIIILFGFHYFFPSTTQPPVQTQASSQQQMGVPAQQLATAAPLLTREEALTSQPQRIQIRSGTLRGSINLQGATLDDLVLTKYRETVNPNSPEIVLLSPENTPNAYFARFGWASSQGSLPNEKTLWQAHGTTLSPQSPVTLSWDNGQGLSFSQVFSLDENYMFTITQRVKNTSGIPLSLNPQGYLAKRGEPKSSGFFILHLGPVGVFDGKLNDPSYEDLAKTNLIQNPKSTGWFGLTDKYWLTAFVPDPKAPIISSYGQTGTGENTLITAQYQRDPFVLAPGQSLESTDYFFAGAKILNLLDGYEETIGINHFDLAVDFGWFYFLTKPIFYALEFLKGILGNFGLAILALTVLIKLLFFPLANKSYSSMGKMKMLQPEIEKIREHYKDDRMKMNEKVMELYKKEKVNPMAGCLPMIIQIPVFFALYKVLFVSIEMRQAPFYGWIHDLSAPDPTTIFNLFGLIPWDPPSFLMIGAWPIIMGGTMFLQQKLSPPPADPTQAKMFLFMPLLFTYLLAQFPAGLVIYWAWNNILSIAQQWVIMKRTEMKNKRHGKSSAK